MADLVDRANLVPVFSFGENDVSTCALSAFTPIDISPVSRSTINCKSPLVNPDTDSAEGYARTGPTIEERPFIKSKSSSRNCLASRCLCSTEEGECWRARCRLGLADAEVSFRLFNYNLGLMVGLEVKHH